MFTVLPTTSAIHRKTDIMECDLKRVNGRLYLIPASGGTRGHGPTGNAKLWAKQGSEFLLAVPKHAM
jgi:homoserine O-acetyltransferase